MSLSIAGVWQVDTWSQTVWANGVWREGARAEYPVPLIRTMLVNADNRRSLIGSDDRVLTIEHDNRTYLIGGD